MLSLQACLGIPDNSGQFQNKDIGQNSDQQIGVNTQQARFHGKIYFTLDRNLYQLDGKLNLKQLTHAMDVRDPALSPDGKWIAFVRRTKNFADLMLLPTTGGAARILLSGDGRYRPNPNTRTGAPEATYLWFAQPSWSADSQHLLFLSDLAKLSVYACHYDDFFLDPQIYMLSITAPASTVQSVAYATAGDGGLRDPAYRPDHPDQIIYTGYTYAQNASQVIQIFLEDPQAITHRPWLYRPGRADCERDPAVPITRPNAANLEPTFAPDGNTILYVRREDSNHMSLYTMTVPSGGTESPASPSLHPTAQASPAQELSSYDQSTRLITQQYLGQPVWSPDGTQILYYGFTNNTFDIWLATIARNPQTGTFHIVSGSQIQLTNSHGHLDADSRACWTP